MWDNGYLQEWAHKLGIGEPTGIDLPGERRRGCCRASSGATNSPPKAKPNRPWSAGDNIQLAIGQGDLQTNPLQMAIAYAALGNGGTIVTPHVGKEVEDAAGPGAEGIRPAAAPPRQHRPRLPRQRSWKGCTRRRRARAAPATDVFGGFPIPVAGKTGTAERAGHARPVLVRRRWRPYPNPKIVTVVTIEEGGFGAESAAPAAQQILEAYFHKQLTKKREGEDEAEAAKKCRRSRTGKRLMYATRARQARPEPFAVRPAIAERLGLAHMDWALAFAAVGAGRLQRLHPRPGDPARRPRQPRTTTSTARRSTRARRRSACTLLARDRLLALPRAAGRHLHLPLRQRSLWSSSSASRRAARGAPSNSLLQLPAIGARQAPARPGACRVRHRWRQARLAEAAHGALPVPRPGPGCARLPAAGPRHRSGVRGRSPSP